MNIDALWQDLKYALRGLRRSRGFTATVVVTLALGIGANAAVFSIVDRLFLRPPAGVVRPDELRRLWVIRPHAKELGELPASNFYSNAQVAAITAEVAGMATIAVYDYGLGSNMRLGDENFEIRGSTTSPNYFALLGIRPALGR